ncbi:hypothetical protein [Loktanella salsilacus]|uniref:hypothetical protein n=1 Tax=Loktanella salsilacus TaxID=195913 RepID=UPI00370408C6
MQFDANRVFPHPVLRADVNDYTRGAFQASVDFRQNSDGDAFVVDIQAQLNVNELSALVKEGKAEFLYILSCRDTLTRHVLRTQDAMIEKELPVGGMRGEVHISKLITATGSIGKYSCPHINAEFGAGPFKFEAGDVLAFDEPHVVYLEPDNFRPLTSIFELSPNDSLDRYQLQFGTNEDRITIELNPYFKELVDAARSDQTRVAVLFNSIYLHAVMDALDKLRSDPDGSERWRGVIKQKMADLGLSLDDLKTAGIYDVASQLLQYPLARLEHFFKNGELADD